MQKGSPKSTIAHVSNPITKRSTNVNHPYQMCYLCLKHVQLVLRTGAVDSCWVQDIGSG